MRSSLLISLSLLCWTARNIDGREFWTHLSSDLRPRLTSTQLEEISTLYSALPPSVLAAGVRLSKKKKKPSFIMLEAERRERTTELLQAPAWREEAELVWGELRVCVYYQRAYKRHES